MKLHDIACLQLSRGEQQYKRQLEEWSAKVVRLGDQLDALQRLVPRQAQPMPANTPVSPAPPAVVPSVSQLRSPPPFPSPAPGPSPILPSASPLMTTWRSPSFSYESSARRGPGFFASGPSSDSKQSSTSSGISSSLRFTAQQHKAPLLSEDEQAACQQLLAAQLGLIANSKTTVLALQERLGELVRAAQHSDR